MDKVSKLKKEIMKLPGVKNAEVYAKDKEVCEGLGVKAAYDVLVRTSNEHMVEGRIQGPLDLAKLEVYISGVVDLGDSNFRNYSDEEMNYDSV